MYLTRIVAIVLFSLQSFIVHVFADIDLSQMDWKALINDNGGIFAIKSIGKSRVFQSKTEGNGQFQVFWAQVPEGGKLSNSRLNFTIKLSSLWTIFTKPVQVYLAEGPYECNSCKSLKISEFNIENQIAISKSIEIKDVPENYKFLQFRVYDDPDALDKKHTYEIMLSDVKILSNATGPLFDGQPALVQLSTDAEMVVGTDDNVGMKFSGNGRLGELTIDGRTILNKNSVLSGLFVRDVKASSVVPVVGDLKQIEGGVEQVSYIGEFGLKITSKVISKGSYIEISGVVSNLSNTDRAITVYFGIPLMGKNWKWTTGLDTDIDISTDNPMYEYTESIYPVSSVINQTKGGLTLAIRMDEPRIFRFSYDKNSQIYFAAIDLALTPVTNVHKVSLNQAPFRILLYKSDPAWGMRSSLEKYYAMFPEFFINRIKRPGGWGIWVNDYEGTAKIEKLYAQGFRYSWGHRESMLKWNNDHGVYNLLYIEPEYFQLSMGDYKQLEDFNECDVTGRLKKLAMADPCEMEAYKKLLMFKNYHYYLDKESFPHWGGSPEQFAIKSTQVVLNSMIYDVNGHPVLNIDKNRPWLGDSGLGAMIVCNLDPDINDGKTEFNLMSLKLRRDDMQAKNKSVIDGVALDCFLGVSGMVDNYRKDHFQYSDIPLSFRSETSDRPMIPGRFSSVEWLRWLRDDDYYKDKILMANLGCCNHYIHDLFGITYLDVLGIEDRVIPNPDYFRILAYHKAVTDLPSGKPATERELKSRMLQCIFPGYGHDEGLSATYSPIFERLALAGWEPVPYVTADSSDIRIERYGKGSIFYLVVHNKSTVKTTKSKLNIGKKLIDGSDFSATDIISKEEIKANGRYIKMELPPLETTVLQVKLRNEQR